MTHIERLAQSGRDLWRNPAVLGAFLLQYILVTVLVVLCALVDIAILGWLNSSTLGPLLSASDVPPEALIGAVWNAKTITTIVVVAGIQFILLTLAACWFTAGAYGMIRNLLLDGSTTLRELPSMARRFIWPLFRFTILRYAILLLPASLLVLAFFSLAGTTPGLVTPEQMMFLLIAFAVFAIIGLVAGLLLLYGEAIIVFEDKGAIAAAKRTLALVRSNFGISVSAGALVLVLMVLLVVLTSLLLMPLSAMASTTQAIGWMMADQGLRIVTNLLLMAFGIIVTIFIFRTYRTVTGGVIRTTPYRARKKKA